MRHVIYIFSEGVFDFSSYLNPKYNFQDDRISCADALAHAYLDEGRLRYHSCMCTCCYTTPAGRHYIENFEPVAPVPFDDSFEKNLHSVDQVKGLCSIS